MDVCKKESPTTPSPPSPSPPPITQIYVDATNGNDSTGDGSATNPYKTITKGLKKASSGMTVYVKAGIYDQALGENFPILMKDGVNLIGTGPETTIVNCNNNASYVFYDAPNSVIEKFSIKGGSEAGVFCKSSTSTIKNCIITDNNKGIHCKASSTIENNKISLNNSSGIYIVKNSSPNIVNNNITKNGTDGVECSGSSSPTIRGNTIRDNGEHGIMCKQNSSPLIDGNTIERNILPGIYCLFNSRPTINNNIIKNNMRYNIDDARGRNNGLINAEGNTWNNPQPRGTVDGPADSRPNYWIKNPGNSIKFSD